MATSVLSAINYAQTLAQTDALGIGSVAGLGFYNDALQAMTRDLINRGIDAAQTQEAYTDITGGQNTYAWPLDMYALKTVEVNWAGNIAQNYLQATAMNVANIQNASFSWLRANQPQSEPLFDNRGDTFELFPTPVISNAQGLRIFYFLTPTEATNVGQAIQYPQTLDYRALSSKIAALYYKSQGDSEMAQTYDAEYAARMDKIIKILAPGTQQPIQPTPLQGTGWNY